METEHSESKTVPKGSKIKFELPDGFVAPENPDPSKDVDLVCSFRVEDGGKTFCMTKLGDTSLPGYNDNDSKTETKPDYSSMVPKEDAGPMGGQQTGMGMASMSGGY